MAKKPDDLVRKARGLTFAVRKDGPFVSRTLPANWKYANKFDEKGRPCFESNNDAARAAREAQAAGEPILYNDGCDEDSTESE